MDKQEDGMRTDPRILLASLVPFKHYVRVRYTGKLWIVYYDGKKEIFRSSLLPKPEKPLDIRYSRRGLYKKGYPKMRLRKIAKGFLSKLPKEYRSYRLLLRLSKLRRSGLRFFINKMRSIVARSLGIISPKYIGKLMRSYNAERFEVVKKSFWNSIKNFFLEAIGRVKVIDLGKRLLILYLKKSG